MILLGLLAAILAAGSCYCWAGLASVRLLPAATISTRSAATVISSYWMAAWTFQVLGLLDSFHLWAIVPLVVLVPVVGLIWRHSLVARVWMAWHRDLEGEVASLVEELERHRWVAVGLAAVAAHLALRMARALATPAFGWDDFTYHLFRAGRWVQHGGFVLEPAPDAWTYYEFFPWGGDLLWAWALVWGAGDVLVPVVAILLWLAVLLVGYAALREIQSSRMTALIVALAISALPSQAGQMSTAYVDNAVLLMVLGASLFLIQLLRSESPRQAWPAAFLVGACIGLGLLIKMSFLPLALPAAVIVGWNSIRSKRLGTGAAFLAGTLVAAPNLLFNWVQRGSPFYPFQILDVLPFNEQHSWILSKYGEGATAAELSRAAKALVFNLFSLDPFLNLGLVGVVLLVLGISGSLRMGRSSRGRWFLLWVAVGAVLTVANFFSPRNSSMVVWWTLMMGRFLVPSLAGLFLLAGLVRPAVLRWLLMPLLVGEYFFYSRRGWPMEQIVATVQILALVGLIVVLGLLLGRWKRRRVPTWAVLSLIAAIALMAMIGVRERYRYDAYRLFAARELLDFHGSPPVEAWPIWRRLDETAPNRVAATAGFDGLTGHNWFRGPLLGPFLQNEVVYLPVTDDGRLVSYRDRENLVAVADREAWLSRMQQAAIDRVVALGPANIEHRWILDLPEIFELEIEMANHHFLLARVDQPALERHLSESSSD